MPTNTRWSTSHNPLEGLHDGSLTPRALEVSVLPITSPYLSSTPQTPNTQCGLQRSLQIPTKRTTITSGFKLPPKLASCGVSREQWYAFQCDIREHASLSGGQWVRNIGFSWLVGTVAGVFVLGAGLLVAVPTSYIYRSRRERTNFMAAQSSGLLQEGLDRWNTQYFEHLGLHVAVEMPASGDMHGADVSSTKLFRYQQKKGFESERAGTATVTVRRKELRYQEKEGRQRLKAARRGRIVIVPLR